MAVFCIRYFCLTTLYSIQVTQSCKKALMFMLSKKKSEVNDMKVMCLTPSANTQHETFMFHCELEASGA